MNNSGDAAEQVVRLSLEGMEVAARITGNGAKDIAILLAAALKEEHKTKGKARLSNMIRSGKELKVFTVRQGDLEKFAKEAKRYGVLYSILKDKGNEDPNAQVDVIARADDASKISRIMERFNLTSLDRGSVKQNISAEKKPMPMGKPEAQRKSVKETIANYKAGEKNHTPSGRNIREPGMVKRKPVGRGAR